MYLLLSRKHEKNSVLLQHPFIPEYLLTTYSKVCLCMHTICTLETRMFDKYYKLMNT